MMVKQQQRRTDRCFLPGSSNNVTLVRFPTQRRPHPSHEGHQPLQALVRETLGEHGEPEPKRICISGSEQTLTNRETAPDSREQTGSNVCSLEDPGSSGDGVQQVVLENTEDNRAAELASGGCLKVTIQRSRESREFGEKDPASCFTCHLCHCTCPSAQSFHEHMSGVDHNRRLQQVSQSVSQPGCAEVLLQESCRRRQRASVRWCDVCESNFTGDVILHRRTTQHKESKKWSRPFCSVCHRLFRTPRKFVEHMKSPDHKRKVQLEKSQEDDMITVDAVGCFETETKEGGDEEGGDEEGGDEEGGDEEGEHRVGAEKDIRDEDIENEEAEKDTKRDGKEESRTEEETRREEASEGNKEARLGDRIGRIELEQRGDKDIRKGAKQGDKKGEMGLDQIQNQAGDKDIGEKERGNKDVGKKESGDKDIGKKERGDKDIGDEEGFDAEDLMEDDIKHFADRDALQELSPHTHQGGSFVVPVSGFFCFLCHKFFFRETSAREQHCSSPQHLQRVLQS